MKFEVRQDHVFVEGYVCVAERDSRVLRDSYGPFTERVKVGCFQRALDNNPNVEVWINHDHAIEARNYKLEEDAIGLHFEGEIYDQDFITAASTGHVDGWSYGFTCVQDEWETREEMRYRTLKEINLFEVSLLVGKIPAYVATSVHCRDDEAVTKEFRFEINAKKTKKDLQKEEELMDELEEDSCGEKKEATNADEEGVSKMENPCAAADAGEDKGCDQMEHPSNKEFEVEYEILTATIELLKLKNKMGG